MRKLVLSIIFAFVLVLSWTLVSRGIAVADVDPRENRDTETARDRVSAFCDPAAFPREARGETLDCPEPTPTSPPGNGGQEPTPTIPPNGGLPSPTSPPGGGGDEDPCAPGKPFSGDYCGWSPRIGGEAGGGAVAQAVGPQIKGLSATSNDDLRPSDIILLTGVLCLLLYAKSKFTVNDAK